MQSEYVFLIFFYFYFYYLLFPSLFCFGKKMGGKKRRLISTLAPDLNLQKPKYQHLELILRENKLTYTKLVFDAKYFETKIGIELSK